jgi:HD superfamily phosphohydrolase
MNRVIDNLTTNQPTLAIEKDRQLLRVSTLLHDLGHFPFSHVIERVMRRESSDGKHESMSRFLLDEKKDWPISEILAKAGLLENVIDIFNGEYESPALYGYLVKSDLDVDRLDYLQRDSLHTGVAYGSVDVERILRTITVDNVSEPQFLVVMEKGTQAIENYVLARYHMYNAVYYHKGVIAFELMLDRLYELLSAPGVDILPRLDAIRGMTKEQFASYDDGYVFNGFNQYLEMNKSDIATDLIRMIYSRIPIREAYHDLVITEESPLKFDKLREDITTRMRDELADDSGIERNWIFVSEPQVQIVEDNDEEAIYVERNGGYGKIVDDDRTIVHRLKGLKRRGYRVFTKEDLVPELDTAIKNFERG